MSVQKIIDLYCEAWSSAEPRLRERLLEGVWAPGASYTDPTVHAIGIQALLAHIATVQARRPGAKILRTSPVDVHHGMGRFAWHVVMPDGTTLPEGLDFVVFTQDEVHIEKIVGFFGPLK